MNRFNWLNKYEDSRVYELASRHLVILQGSCPTVMAASIPRLAQNFDIQHHQFYRRQHQPISRSLSNAACYKSQWTQCSHQSRASRAQSWQSPSLNHPGTTLEIPLSNYLWPHQDIHNSRSSPTFPNSHERRHPKNRPPIKLHPLDSCLGRYRSFKRHLSTPRDGRHANSLRTSKHHEWTH